MRKRSSLLVVGACLATLSLAVGTALADPSGAPTFRNLAGTGSDTTQGVLNALANAVTISGVKQIGSYDAASATNSATITTKDPAVNPNCTINRPSGSGAGINALVADRTAGTHCLQFARSSANDASTRSGSHLTYIPFATDGVAYATREFSAVSRNLSVATLKRIYTCDPTLPANTFEPLLPQSGSGTRKFFLQNILGLTDSSDYTTLNPCVSDKDPGDPTRSLLENTGKLLTDDKQIEPYSIAVWISQVGKAPGVTDDHGSTLLGNVGGVLSLGLNSSAVGTRPVYNVLPNRLVTDGPNSKATFVGSGSLVCTNTAAIVGNGFATRSDCGSTTIQSDNSPGTDTVGPGE